MGLLIGREFVDIAELIVNSLIYDVLAVDVRELVVVSIDD